MTPALWWSIAVTILALLAVWLLIAIDNRHARRQSKQKTIPPDLPPEGRWR